MQLRISLSINVATLIDKSTIKLGANRRDAEGAEMEINDITGKIVDAALSVHRKLGLGLLEHTYQACLKYELSKRNI